MRSFVEGDNNNSYSNNLLNWEEMRMHYNIWGFDEIEVWWYPFYNFAIDGFLEDGEEIVWQHDVWNLMDIQQTPNP